MFRQYLLPVLVLICPYVACSDSSLNPKPVPQSQPLNLAFAEAHGTPFTFQYADGVSVNSGEFRAIENTQFIADSEGLFAGDSTASSVISMTIDDERKVTLQRDGTTLGRFLVGNETVDVQLFGHDIMTVPNEVTITVEVIPNSNE